MIIYTVRPGDTLNAIARRYGISPQSIQDDNDLSDPSQLVVGQTLAIVLPEVTYTVRAGDTLYSVAQTFGVSINQLMRNNPVLGGGTDLTPGQVLKIKLPSPTGGTVRVNAYAYPYIDRDVLRRTLPYLTYLSIFTYGFRPDGTLIDIPDEELISLAKQYGVSPVLHLSSLGEDGYFSTELAALALQNPEVRANLIRSVRQKLEEKGYAGVDVDFEYVGRENADAYTNFIREMHDALSPLGYFVWVALAPKVRADQEGTLYEGHDYRALGEIADAALLMTYEWGYTYGPPLAVSPINQVRRVLDFGTEEIPPSKLFLGVPNYGYDWTLPYVAGESRARSLGNVEAVDLARERNAAISFDELAQSPFYNYFVRSGSGTTEHEVWFEDGRSATSMLALMPEYDLRGMAVWNIMKFFPQLWLVLNSNYNIAKVTQ